MHLKPQGSSYTAETRTFLTNTKASLSLTDIDIGSDGHMYFCVGGRKQQSYLYRVRYVGSNSTELSKLDTTSVHAQARKARHMLESYHGKENPHAVEVAWPYLKSSDYHLRYAARIALEWQNPKIWANQAYEESNDLVAIHALLGLARCDFEQSMWPSIERLLQVDFTKLTISGRLLCFVHIR